MTQKKQTFFTRLFQLFFPQDDIEAIKKRHLKAIAKEITKSKFGKWYKPRSQELLQPVGRFFYDVYKVVGPAQALLLGADSSKILKTITIEQSFSKKQQKLRERLRIDAIELRAKELSCKELAVQVKHELKLFMQSFDKKKIKEIDTAYQHLNEFIQLVLFDYHYFLKKFDSALPEHKFTYVPNYTPVTGGLVLEELKDFAVIIYTLSFEANWEKVFAIITAYKNVEPVNLKEWKKTIAFLQGVVRSNMLEKIIQHISEIPSYAIKISVHTETITEPYIKKMKTEITAALKQLAEQEKKASADNLAERIFGTEISSGTKHYHPRSNLPFKKRGLDGYLYADALNYLKSFLIEYFKTDARELADLLLVRGQWIHDAKLPQYTDSYHALMQLSPAIIEFDENLSEVSEMGVKFHTLLSRMEREKDAGRKVEMYLREINDNAADLLKAGMKHIIVMGTAIKECITDYENPYPSLLRNWKEVEQHAGKPLREWMRTTYTRMYHIVNLEKVLLTKTDIS